MQTFFETLGRVVLFVLALVYVTCYCIIRTGIELINFPFERIEDEAENYVGFIIRKEG